MAAHSRIRTAIDDGLLSLPAGDVHVMRPGVDFDFAALGSAPVHVSHGFVPTFEALASSGLDMSVEPRPATVACVVVPRFKGLARSMIAQAATMADLVLVDGQKTDGIDSHFKAVRKQIGDVPSVAKSHGRLFWFPGTDAFKDWLAPEPVKGPHGYFTAAGVFSDGEVDKGSELLAGVLPSDLKGRVADFGAGWGYLSAKALKSADVASLDLIEAEALALDCARLNVEDPRAAFHWADATEFKAAEPYDMILMNPPFHTGRSGNPDLGCAFIEAAARNLKPRGSLWMVANRHLPYERQIEKSFAEYREVGGNTAFKIFHASRPRR